MKSFISTSRAAATMLIRRFGLKIIALILIALTAVPAARAADSATTRVFIQAGSANQAYFYNGDTNDGPWFRLMGTGPRTAFQLMISKTSGMPASVDWSTGVATYAGRQVPGITLHMIEDPDGRLIGYTADLESWVRYYTPEQAKMVMP